MKKLKQIVSAFTLGFTLMTACNDAPPIIKEVSILPIPVSLKQDTTCFVLPKSTTIGINDPQLKPAAEYLASILSPATGYCFKVSEGQGSINLGIGIIEGTEDAYTLVSNSETVNITGNTYRGVIAGIQSLRQLFPAEIEAAIERITFHYLHLVSWDFIIRIILFGSILHAVVVVVVELTPCALFCK